MNMIIKTITHICSLIFFSITTVKQKHRVENPKPYNNLNAHEDCHKEYIDMS
jgi:hypothetical protein